MNRPAVNKVLDGTQSSNMVANLSSNQNSMLSFSLNDVFGLMIQELHEVYKKLASLQQELPEEDSNYSANSTHTEGEEDESKGYFDILCDKGSSVQHLETAIKTSVPLDAAKYKSYWYQNLSSLVSDKYNEAKNGQIVRKAEFEVLKSKSAKFKEQSDLISTILELDDDNEEAAEEQNTALKMFHDARQDLNIVLSAIYPMEEDKRKFTSSLQPLIEAYKNNIDNEDNQYVAVPDFHKFRSLQCLKEENLIIPHPEQPHMYRLVVED